MSKFLATAALAAGMFAASVPVHAGLVLTAAGIADGFTLTTFASGSHATYPYLAAAVLSDGNLAVVDYGNGRLVKYADLDNRTPGDALVVGGSFGAVNVASVGGKTYATSQSSGLFEVASNLSLTHIAVPAVNFTWGLWGNQVTGHLLAATAQGLADIDPTTGTTVIISALGSFDGVSVSADGTKAYAEDGNDRTIKAYDIVTHALLNTFTSGSDPDGTGVISGGTLSGHIVTNNNDGTVREIDPTTGISTIIATGGSRGDFTSADSNDGSLFLATSDVTYRLKIAGGTIGGGTTPEPMSLALVGIALLGAGLARRREA